jgi:glyoxylase-like metal-dependent hydrolase (beta-lactamase superfamily II)
MRQLLPGIYLVEGLRAAHAYLLTSEDGHTLVDAGTPGEADRIQGEIEDGGFSLSDVKAIVLTHAHNDHAGSAAELAERSGAEVVAHQTEVPYIEGTAPLPFTALHKRAFSWLGDQLLRAKPCTVDRALQDGDVIDALGGLQVVHAPGHTPGCMALYQPDRQILFLGDVLFHREEGPGLPPSIVSVDVDMAAASARKVASLPSDVACFGHGEPILEEARERLREAAGD